MADIYQVGIGIEGFATRVPEPRAERGAGERD
jgi:hypothetical protein